MTATEGGSSRAGAEPPPRLGVPERLVPLFGAASGCRAAAQVRHAPQAQSVCDVAETLATGREEAAQESALA
jgi:hypothetical protein